MGAHGTHADLSLLLMMMRPNYPAKVRHAGARAARRLLQRDSDEAWVERARGSVSDALLVMLDDPFIDTRAVAIRELGLVGDERSVAELLVFSRTNQVIEPPLSSRALDAAERIRVRDADASSPMPEPSKDQEVLDERLKELEERLKRLEDWR
jgi:hypothetical protein